MKNQEFVIKGTIEEIIKVLEKDFDMPTDEAKYFVYIMINQHNEEAINIISKDKLDLWYLSEENKYEGFIFNTHLAINFTLVEKSLYHSAYMFLVKWMFARNIDLVLIGADLVYAIASAISKIKDTDYCVFSRIIELCIGNKERIFNINDIKTKNKDGKCDYQENWKCPYFKEEENCICNQDKIILSLSSLAKQNLVKKVGDHWILIR